MGLLKKTKVNLTPWLTETIINLMMTAEMAFEGDEGAKKKEWVTEQVLDLAKRVDAKRIPNWIEDPLEAKLIPLAIDLVWFLLFSKGRDYVYTKLSVMEHASSLLEQDDDLDL